MRLIVCEKLMAASRIAGILSNNKSIEKKIYGIPYYEWKDNLVIGLSGHVIQVNFPEEYKSWTKVSLSDLAKAEVSYIDYKKNIINAVRKLAKEASEVVISVDNDSEGEAIGFEAIDIIKRINPRMPFMRALFSAITKEDIIASFDKLVSPNKSLADSANTRREIDLIWGAVLTRFISLAAKRYGDNFLSVGRCQSPTLKFLVDREKERRAFKGEDYWALTALLNKDKDFTAVYEEARLFDKIKADKIAGIKAKDAKVLSVNKRLSETSPPLPFDTTQFLRAAASAGFIAQNASRIAESLYLKGLISYPRTSNQKYPKTIGLKSIVTKLGSNKIYNKFCEAILKSSINATSGKESKDHPPIHPTGELPSGLNSQEFRIYDLIVRRFLATLSPPSKEEKTKIAFDIAGYKFVSQGLVILAPGFREVYTFLKTRENFLPKLSEGEIVLLKNISCEAKKTEPPSHYGYGSIIRLMDENNIGTKATRPGILQKLVDRGYVSSGRTLVPSEIAFAVVDSLCRFNVGIIEPKMTADLEERMNEVEEGVKNKDVVVDGSRGMLLEVLSKMTPHSAAIGDEVRKAMKTDLIIGKCPKCREGDMKIMHSYRTRKNFCGCSSYPKCNNGWPLPTAGLLKPIEECKACGIKKIMLVRKGKRPFKFCPNLSCPDRKEIPKKDNNQEAAKKKGKKAKE